MSVGKVEPTTQGMLAIDALLGLVDLIKEFIKDPDAIAARVEGLRAAEQAALDAEAKLAEAVKADAARKAELTRMHDDLNEKIDAFRADRAEHQQALTAHQAAMRDVANQRAALATTQQETDRQVAEHQNEWQDRVGQLRQREAEVQARENAAAERERQIAINERRVAGKLRKIQEAEAL